MAADIRERHIHRSTSKVTL